MGYFLVALSFIAVLYFSARQLKNFINETLEKKLKSAEELSQKSDNFIKNKWPADLDISKADLHKWAQRVKKRIKLIDECLSQLTSKQETWKEHAWIRDPALKASREKLREALLAQKTVIQSNFNDLVDSIPKKVDQLILKIKPDFRDPKQFVPSMEASQLEKLTDFVNTYGSEQTKHAFVQNTNLINLFSNALDLNDELNIKFISKQSKNEHLIPTLWGGYCRLEAQFEGWRNLINGWMVKGPKKEALMAILSLLEGKLSLTPEEFDEKFKILELENDKLKNNIQTHLFLLLDSGVYLKLLNKTDQKKIEDWYLANKAEILRAKQLVEAILNEPNTQIPEAPVLENYFHLLDCAALISDIQSEYRFQNLVRDYFKNYQGDHPSAHLFLRFVPENTPARRDLTQQVLIKRLEWFIRIACSGIVFKSDTISRRDISLFNDDRVHPDKDKICFIKFIDEKLKQHDFYQKSYTPSFNNFLEIWANHGLCSEDVQSSYHAKSRSVGASLGI